VAQQRSKRGFPVPVLEGVLPIDRARLSTDVIAGITLAALGIPEVMGYTKIAGMPVITGLYTILIPIAVFAVLGSSRHLVVGADSATAAIMAAGLAGMAPIASPQYVALAGAMAIVTGAILLVARLIRLGFLADFGNGLESILGDDDRSRVEVHGLVDRRHHAVCHQFLDDFDRAFFDLLRQVADHDAGRELYANAHKPPPKYLAGTTATEAVTEGCWRWRVSESLFVHMAIRRVRHRAAH